MIFFLAIYILETHKKTSYIIKLSQNVSLETRNLIPLKLKSRCEDKNVANTLQSWMNEFERHIRRIQAFRIIVANTLQLMFLNNLIPFKFENRCEYINVLRISHCIYRRIYATNI